MAQAVMTRIGKGEDIVLRGSPVSAGIGIGRALIVQQDEIVVSHRVAADKEAEKIRYTDAAKQFCAEIQHTADAMNRAIGMEEARIIEVQCAIVQNSEMTKEIFAFIDQHSVVAEYAVDVIFESYIQLFDSLQDELLRSRAADVRDVKISMLNILMDIQTSALLHIPEDSILVADDISPSQAATMDHSKVSAIVTQLGTRFSHIAIIARALEIPTVVAVDNACASVQEGERLIVDAEQGAIHRNPTRDKVVQYCILRDESRKRNRLLQSYRNKETLTADKKRIDLMANLSMSQELSSIADSKVDGIGLFRTEFLYLNSTTAPSEAQQIQSYRQVLQAMGGKRVVIRTIDVGGDKHIPCLRQEQEENPFLGQRGIRFSIARPDVFKTQISALLQASAYGNLKIMLPMVSTVSELRKAKRMIQEVKNSLFARGIPFDESVPVGIMIETPAAAICADTLAREADFFSLGTNDLTQYTLAVDRGNDTVAHLYSPLHPAVLRLLKQSIDGGHRAGIAVKVCGEIPSEMMLIPLLVGMGVDAISVTASSVLQVRQAIAEVSYEFWQDKIDQVLTLSTTTEVIEYIRRTQQRYLEYCG